MQKEHVQLLQRHHLQLQKDLELMPDLVSFLYQNDLLTPTDMEKIARANQLRHEQFQCFLDILVRRGPRAFDLFYCALVYSKQLHLAELLEPLIEPNKRGLSGKEAEASAMANGHKHNHRESNHPSASGAQGGTATTTINMESPPPTYEEVQAAQHYYEQQLPSFVDGGVLAKVKQTLGLLPADGLESVDVASSRKPLPAFDPVQDYANFSMPRGLAVIFNNMRFKSLPIRQGTDVDARNMADLLKQLGYQVKIKQNLSAKEMYDAMARFALKSEHNKCDSSVVVVLSHGEHGKLYGADDTLISVDQIMLPLDAANCPALRDKPKLFFLQACRGKDFDSGHGDFVDGVRHRADKDLLPKALTDADTEVALRLMEDSQRLNLFYQSIQAIDTTDARELLRKIPTGADMFIGYATTPGFVSWRNNVKGSWFIQSICQVFAQHAHHQDLLSLMTMVNRQVAEAFASSQGSYKQVPEPTSRLRRKFYFYPGRSDPRQ